MSTPEPRDFVESLTAFLTARMVEHLVELGVAWAGSRQVAPNGLRLSRQDRIMQFVEDHESGLLDEMAVVAPKALERYVAQFRRDIRREVPELVEAPTPAGSGTFAPYVEGGGRLSMLGAG